MQLFPEAAAAPVEGSSSKSSGSKSSSSGGGSSSSSSSGTAAAAASAPLALPPGWIEAQDASGRTYYFNEVTRISRWDVPTGAAAESIAVRQAAEKEEAARRLEARRAELREAESRESAEREEASRVRAGLRKTVAAWADERGWCGRKQLRRAIRLGAVGAATLPKRIMMSLLSGLEGVPVEGWKAGRILGTSQPLAVPAGWTWSDASAGASECVADGALRKAYQVAVRCLHPDKTQSLPLALRLAGEEVFGVVNEAWEALKDHESGTLAANAAVGGEEL